MSDSKLTPAETYREIMAPSGVVQDGVWDNRISGFREDWKAGHIRIHLPQADCKPPLFKPWGYYPDVPRAEVNSAPGVSKMEMGGVKMPKTDGGRMMVCPNGDCRRRDNNKCRHGKPHLDHPDDSCYTPGVCAYCVPVAPEPVRTCRATCCRDCKTKQPCGFMVCYKHYDSCEMDGIVCEAYTSTNQVAPDRSCDKPASRFAPFVPPFRFYEIELLWLDGNNKIVDMYKIGHAIAEAMNKE